jgi:alpha-glucosidase (family GH31 glycosyl hydrolase)
MSIMRVHSTSSDLPHFPFLYPKDKADAMRSALQLRYQLLPHFYSLAHEQFNRGLPIARPLFMEFPLDLSVVNTVRSS